jgi:hypothetical protein
MLLAVLAGTALPLSVARAQTFAYDGAPLRRVIEDAERRTPYRFLYRDALVAGKTVTLRADAATLLRALGEVLAPQGVTVEVDEARRQVLLTASGAAPPPEARRAISGVVLDAVRGSPVPYAAVVWTEDGRLTGVPADEEGAFAARLPAGEVALTASSVGFHPQTVAASGARVVFRLTPLPLAAAEQIVTSLRLDATLDTALARVAVRQAAPGTAEPSVRRALEAFPSVGVGPAFAEGPRVRGLRADGFEVLLDGVPVYSPTHLFGLFDAFSPDALQPVAFHYDVAPAHFFGPPGGTIAFATRTGPRSGQEVSAALGSSSARLAYGRPLAGGRGGVFAAGRVSTLGRIPWPGTADVLRTGLDAGRETSAPPPGLRPLRETIFYETAHARFSDLHLRLDGENERGGTLSFSAYLGGDDAGSEGERFLPASRANNAPVRTPVETQNQWGSGAASLQFGRTRGVWRTDALLGLSRYRGRYGRDDFTFILPPLNRGGQPRAVIDTLGYENALTDARLALTVGRLVGRGRVAAGAVVTHYATGYAEQAERTPRFVQQTSAVQADAYAEGAYVSGPLRLDAGVRLHTFSEGRYARLSPRLRAETGGRTVSVALGYTRNVQFLHRLYLDGVPSASVWVMTTPEQPPTTAQGASAGVYVRPSGTQRIQVEVYGRRFRHLWQHETNATVRARERESLLQQPWVTDLDGRSRGFEALYHGTFGHRADAPPRLTLLTAYTFARTLLTDPEAPDDPFRAADDRTHQTRAALGFALSRALSVDLAAVAASGAPNPLAYNDPAQPETLAPYVRADAAVRGTFRVGRARVNATLAAFNVTDRKNPWYREQALALDAGRRALTFVPVDVYDLGFTPSFEVSVRW